MSGLILRRMTAADAPLIEEYRASFPKERMRVTFDPDRIPGLDGRHYVKALVGEGALDTPAIVRELIRQNYDGFVDIEYVGSKYQPAEAVSRAVRYLDKLIDGLA